MGRETAPGGGEGPAKRFRSIFPPSSCRSLNYASIFANDRRLVLFLWRRNHGVAVFIFVFFEAITRRYNLGLYLMEEKNIEYLMILTRSQPDLVGNWHNVRVYYVDVILTP